MCCGKAALTAADAPKNKTAGTNSVQESMPAFLLLTAVCLLPTIFPKCAAERRLAARY